MIVQIIWMVLRILAVLLVGFVSAVIGFVVVVNLGFMINPEFAISGQEGYEATGPIGFTLGALIGLIGSSMILFRKRIAK
jgi:hypothetical protein